MTSKIITVVEVLLVLVTAQLLGCTNSSHTHSRNYALSDMPVDSPQEDCGFEDRVTGGQLFKMYCSACHNGRPLGERNFRASEAAFSHMRTQSYLTGEEYRKLIHYLRRWHKLGPPVPDVEPSPKRFFYSQPISELKPKAVPSEANVADSEAINTANRGDARLR